MLDWEGILEFIKIILSVFLLFGFLVVSDSLWPHELYSPWNSPGQNTGVGSSSLLQGIFPTQGWKPSLHCRQILYQLSHKGSPPSSIYFLYWIDAHFISIVHMWVKSCVPLFTLLIFTTCASLLVIFFLASIFSESRQVWQAVFLRYRVLLFLTHLWKWMKCVYICF